LGDPQSELESVFKGGVTHRSVPPQSVKSPKFISILLLDDMKVYRIDARKARDADSIRKRLFVSSTVPPCLASTLAFEDMQRAQHPQSPLTFNLCTPTRNLLAIRRPSIYWDRPFGSLRTLMLIMLSVLWMMMTMGT
jgi:hypothetical protein